MIDLRQGDCLELMKDIPDGSVDAIITDPPYGTTACKWDSVIPFEPMWERINKLIKPNGAIVLFGSEPFSSALRMSNIKNYKYDWIWEKDKGANFATSRKQPLKKHEIISVFYKKQPYYDYKGKELDKPLTRVLTKSKGGAIDLNGEKYNILDNGERKLTTYTHETKKSLIYCKRDSQYNGSFHPTQKPVALMEYLIKTYTHEGETVLDFTMGSGSTGVACKNLNRDFIGIELNETYFNIAKERIEKERQNETNTSN
jgi:site-specific DNA-methyltransferase (adenine-specific)